jgi:hypothetical protein
MDYSWPVEADQQDMVGQRGFAQVWAAGFS